MPGSKTCVSSWPLDCGVAAIVTSLPSTMTLCSTSPVAMAVGPLLGVTTLTPSTLDEKIGTERENP